MNIEPTRRQLLADAAIAVLADQGSRGLTHRAVDAAAGLAPGSTSYYFRTRQALLEALVERLVELQLPVLDALEVPPNPDFADVVRVFGQALESVRLNPANERARYEITLEAMRRPELGAALARGRKAFVDIAVHLLTEAGFPRPEQAGLLVLALVNGMLLDQLSFGEHHHPPVQDRAMMHTLLAALKQTEPE